MLMTSALKNAVLFLNTDRVIKLLEWGGVGGQEQDRDADGARWWGWQGMLCSVLSGTWSFRMLGWDEQPELGFPIHTEQCNRENE